MIKWVHVYCNGPRRGHRAEGHGRIESSLTEGETKEHVTLNNRNRKGKIIIFFYEIFHNEARERSTKCYAREGTQITVFVSMIDVRYNPVHVGVALFQADMHIVCESFLKVCVLRVASG